VKQRSPRWQRVFLLRSLRRHGFRQSIAALSAAPDPALLGALRGRIDRAGYAALVAQAKAFLSGHQGAVQRELAGEMEAAAEALEFEHAAAVRDRIAR